MTCYLECPSHTFYSPAILNSTQYLYTCMICSSNCLECSSISTYCMSCNTSLYLYQYIVNSINLSECVNICPSTTYGTTVSINDTALLKCLPCDSPCTNCATNSTTCLSCLSTFYKYINITRNNTNNLIECITQCPVDITIANSTTMSCIYCMNPCTLCSNTPNNCTSCISGYFQINNQLMNDISTNGTNNTYYGYTCLAQCPTRTLSIDNYTCQKCTSPCLTCNNSLTSCIKCVPGYLKSSIDAYLCVILC